MTPTRHPLQESDFDALALLRRMRGSGDEARETKLRLLWLRQREPDARVTTELVALDDRGIVMAASVALPSGGEGAGHAASPLPAAEDLGETIERLELRALARALDILGYVLTDGTPAEEAPEAPGPVPEADRAPREPEAEPTPSPSTSSRRPPEHIQALRALREREQPPTVVEPPAEAEPEAERDEEPARPTPLPTERRPERPAPPPAAQDDDEPELEDVSWTAFWTWARQTYQIGSRVQVEELLGQPVARKTPGELRRLLTAHFEG